MTRIEIWILFLSLLVLSGCNRFSADASRTTFQPIQISAPEVDAAEAVTASAPDGGVYVAWVNHDANNQADVLLARFDNEGTAITSPVKVNPWQDVFRESKGRRECLPVL